MEYRKLEDLRKLENNPRKISSEDFQILVKSIKDNPDYFEARPLLLSDRTGELVIIAGNQRYDAAKFLGLKEVPTYLRKNIENDIHKISMTPNLADENFANNSSGVAISYKLLAFDQNIKNKERYFERGLMERFRLYNNFLNTKSSMPIVPTEEVDAIFKRNLPRNDYETSQMILNLQGIVDKELLVSQLSFVRDSKETVELAAKEDETTLESAAEFAKNEIKDANNGADEVE